MAAPRRRATSASWVGASLGVSGDEDELGREGRGDEAEASAELLGLAGEGLECVGVGLLGEVEEVLDGLAVVDGGVELGVVAEGGTGGGEGLPTAPGSAAAEGAFGIDGDVAELSGHAVAAVDELAVGEDSGSDALGYRDEDGVADAVHAAEPGLREEAGVGRVVELDGHAGSLLEDLLDVEVGPGEIGGEDEAMGAGIDAAGQADAYTLKRTLGVPLLHAEHGLEDAVGGLDGIGGDGELGSGEKAAVEVDDGYGGLRGADVGDEHDEVVVEADHGGATATGELRRGAFADPALEDQLIDDEGDGAALEA